MKEKQIKITFSETASSFFSGHPQVMLLLGPLLNPNNFIQTDNQLFVKEFTGAFGYLLLIDGEFLLETSLKLQPQSLLELISILCNGGIEELEFSPKDNNGNQIENKPLISLLIEQLLTSVSEENKPLIIQKLQTLSLPKIVMDIIC